MAWKVAEVDIYGERVRYRFTSEAGKIEATGYDNDGDKNMDEVLFCPFSDYQPSTQSPEDACLELQRVVSGFQDGKLERILDRGFDEIHTRGVLQGVSSYPDLIFIEVPASTPLKDPPFQLMCDRQRVEPVSLTLLADNGFPRIDIIGAPSLLERFKPACLNALKLPKE